MHFGGSLGGVLEQGMGIGVVLFCSLTRGETSQNARVAEA